MVCKGICIKYKNNESSKGGKYKNGKLRCQICAIFIKWDGIWCPCCGYKLRTKPRMSKYRDKYNIKNNIKRIV